MKEQKKGSPLGTLWSWGKAHHGKFVFSIILAILGVACQMIPYFCVVNVISKMFCRRDCLLCISACMSCGFDRILREGAFFKPVNSNFP